MCTGNAAGVGVYGEMLTTVLGCCTKPKGFVTEKMIFFLTQTLFTTSTNVARN